MNDLQHDLLPPKRALISVSDKTGIIDLANFLSQRNFEILASGKTCETIQKGNLPVTHIADYTGFPEILGGRVKTLHPKIHGGILARRSSASDQNDLKKHGIHPIDLVIANLYPFSAQVKQLETSLREDHDESELLEFIDIGGLALLRAAAKNFQDVTVLAEPQDYGVFQNTIGRNNVCPLETRRDFAAKVFQITAHYEKDIAEYLTQSSTKMRNSKTTHKSTLARHSVTPWSDHMTLTLQKKISLRYGENAHQQAALFQHCHHTNRNINDGATPKEKTHSDSFLSLRQDNSLLQKLSYNNFLDIEAALRCQSDLLTMLNIDRQIPDAPADSTTSRFASDTCIFIIVKHQIPCGIGISCATEGDIQDTEETEEKHSKSKGQEKEDATCIQAWQQAWACDPVSAYGGIVCCSQPITPALAQSLKGKFFTIICAPKFPDESKKILLQNRPNLHLVPIATKRMNGKDVGKDAHYKEEIRLHQIDSSHWLVQKQDVISEADFPSRWQCVTETKSSAMSAMGCAWCLTKNLKSNAIVLWQPTPNEKQRFANLGICVGIGNGQPNRVRSAEIAIENAIRYGNPLQGSIAASDGFLPFPDTVRLLAKSGITAIVQPGGSKKDAEVIRVASELGLAMYFTNRRHFLH